MFWKLGVPFTFTLARLAFEPRTRKQVPVSVKSLELDRDPDYSSLMAGVKKNQHRWRNWINDAHVLEFLDETASRLKRTWQLDKRSPKSFPVQTWWLFVQAEDFLGNKPRLLVKGKVPPTPKNATKVVRSHSGIHYQSGI